MKSDPDTRKSALPTPMNGDELIDLCSSSDEDSPTKQTASIIWEPDCLDDDNDDECMIVEPPTTRYKAATATTGSTFNASESDDLEILGATGPNALSDFPHSRQDCVTHPMARATAILFCKNCYCFVCDIKASECHLWRSHCHAKKE
jgi:hypothetical protein